MTFFRVGCVLLILFLTPLVFFEIIEADAAFPQFVSKERERIFPSTSPTNLINITSISIGSQSDRLLTTLVSLDNKAGPSTDSTVSWMSFGPTGNNCNIGGLGYQNFTGNAPVATSNQPGVTTNEIWILKEPAQNQDCNVLVGLSQVHGNHGIINKTAAVARTVFWYGVDQTNPIEEVDDVIASGFNPTTDFTTSTNSSQIILDVVSSGTTGDPTATVPQTRQNKYSSSTNWNTAYSIKSGIPSSDFTSWTLGASAPWAISAVIINSCDVSSSCTVTSSSSSSSSNPYGSCKGDCSPPTLGIDENDQRVVSDGFAFNDYPIDAELYYTPYPLITAYVGEENAIALRIYENDGPDNLAHVGVAFGLGYGESFAESNAIINWDRDYDGTENLSLIDPYNVLANVTVNVTEVDCDNVGSRCTDMIFYHTFRAPLEFNMVATNMWDHDRNAWQNYFNHGLQVVGESLNPPNIYDGIYKGKIYQLTEVEKNKSVDEDGDTWTFDYGIWNKDYLHAKKIDRELVNAEKIWAINHVLQENSIGDSSDLFNYDRLHDQFSIQKEYQIILAEGLLEEICPKCFDDEFEEIDDISYYEFDLPIKRTDDPEFVNSMKYEAEMAEFLLEDMMTSFYPGKVFDEDNFD